MKGNLFTPASKRWLVIFVLIVPWVNPFAGGPTPALVPQLVSIFSVCAFLLLCINSRVDVLKVAANAWLLAAVTSSLLGLVQYFGLSASFSPWINVTDAGEAFANLRQRNQFATLMNIGLAAVTWSAMDRYSRFSANAHVESRTSSRAVPWNYALTVGASLLLAVGNAASSSRTGAVQLALLISALLFWGRLRQPAVWPVLFAAALAYAIAAFALPQVAGFDPTTTGILARLHKSDSACSSRIILWSNVLHLIAQKPWFGWGWGELDYAHFMALYPGPRFCEILDNAHNLPLHLAVELGVPIAAVVCGFGVWLLSKARPWRETNQDRQLAWLVLAVIFLHSMLEYPLWYGPFQIAAGLSIWVLWTTRPQSFGQKSRAFSYVRAHQVFALISLPSTVAGAVLCMVGATYVAWDYHRISQIYLPAGKRTEFYRQNTLEKLQRSWLFSNQVRFAELTTTQLKLDNAAYLNAMAHDLLHFSPEARVVEKLIESAVMLRRDEEAKAFLARYKSAFPKEFADWESAHGLPIYGSPLARGASIEN